VFPGYVCHSAKASETIPSGTFAKLTGGGGGGYDALCEENRNERRELHIGIKVMEILSKTRMMTIC
jgi:hypothetical protein